MVDSSADSSANSSVERTGYYWTPHRSRLRSLGVIVGTCSCVFLSLVTTQAVAQFRDASGELGFSGGAKAAFADFDNDGFVDLFNGKLFRNQAGKHFAVVETSALPQGAGIWGDYDNDGRTDLFVYSDPGGLYRNEGGGKFRQVEFPELPTVNSRGAVWADINQDGYLDLYVGGYEIWQQEVHPDAIFLNLGDGTFREHWRSQEGARYAARGVTSLDFNEDGAIDIYVSNYRLQPNCLWKNDGGGSFKDVAQGHKVAGNPSGEEITYTGGIKYRLFGHTIGSAVGDLDNDGHIDIVVGNFSHPRPGQDRPQFLRNRGPQGNFQFEDRSADAGLNWQESFASAALGDYDNDGDLDLFFTTVYSVGSGNIKNFPVLYSNQGNWNFADVTATEQLQGLGPTYQAAWADIDNDGDLDLCSDGKLFINQGRENNWITVTLVGDGKQVNRSAIGATVRIRVGDRVLTRQVESGTGEGNQNDPRLHFGLGLHKDPVNLTITWPGNDKQQVNELTVNRQHVINYPSIASPK